MTEKTTTTIVTGLRSGHVTYQKRFQPLAPSSDDASCRSGLIVCSPASSVIAKNGMPRHVLTTIAHHMPYVPSERNGSLVVMRSALNRSEEHTSELQSRSDLVCRLLLEKKKTRSPAAPRQTER